MNTFLFLATKGEERIQLATDHWKPEIKKANIAVFVEKDKASTGTVVRLHPRCPGPVHVMINTHLPAKDPSHIWKVLKPSEKVFLDDGALVAFKEINAEPDNHESMSSTKSTFFLSFVNRLPLSSLVCALQFSG